MKPDGMLVETKHLVSAGEEVAGGGVENALAAVAAAEPALASYLQGSLTTVAGKLALAGAPSAVVQGCNEDVLTIALTCVQALRRGHYDLWSDSWSEKRVAELDPALKPKRRRRKSTSNQGDSQ